MSQLDLKNIPTLKGNETKEKFKRIANILLNTKLPLYLVGPSGSGKTIMSFVLAKWYSKKFKVPAYYIQLSPDQTKTSVILGLRLVNGSLSPTNGVVADAMENGGIIIIDEATHATQELLLMFNGILDRTSITSVGDKTIMPKDTFRIIFSSNDSTYAGNNKIPQSFAQRLIVEPFKYPNHEEEAMIAKKMVIDELGECVISDAVIKYTTSLIRQYRTETFPLSVRNISNSIILMQIQLNEDKTDEDIKKEIDKINKDGGEAKAKKVYQRIYGKNLQEFDTVLQDENIKSFFEDVANVGIDNFREAILSASMYYIDIEGFGLDILEIKEKLKMAILTK